MHVVIVRKKMNHLTLLELINGQTANKASSFSPSKRYLFAPCFKHIKLINISQIYSAVLILPYLSFVCKKTLDI